MILKNKMLSNYKIRIDSHAIQSIRMLFTKYFDRYIVAFEGGEENPHCHAIASSTAKSATIRSNIRKLFGSGNGSYSMKELDEEYPLEYIAYILKEGKYENSGYPESILQEAKDYDLKIKQEIKEKKQERRTILQKIDDEYFSNIEDGVIDGHYVDRHYVVSSVLDFYKKSGTLIREFQLISLSQTLCLKYIPHYTEELKCRVLDKL